MGTSKTADELAGKLKALADSSRKGAFTGTNNAARQVSDVFYKEAKTSIRGPNLAGKRWGTAVEKARSVDRPQAVVKYRGPVHWIESGTGAHTVVSKKVGGSRARRSSWPTGPGMFKGARRRGAVLINGTPRAYGRHPGTKARPFFARAKKQAGPVAARELRNTAIEEPLNRIFR